MTLLRLTGTIGDIELLGCQVTREAAVSFLLLDVSKSTGKCPPTP
jgi:hypothetical protein